MPDPAQHCPTPEVTSWRFHGRSLPVATPDVPQAGDLRQLLLFNRLTQRLKMVFRFFRRPRAECCGFEKMAIEASAERGMLRHRRATLAQKGELIFQLLQ